MSKKQLTLSETQIQEIFKDFHPVSNNEVKDLIKALYTPKAAEFRYSDHFRHVKDRCIEYSDTEEGRNEVALEDNFFWTNTMRKFNELGYDAEKDHTMSAANTITKKQMKERYKALSDIGGGNENV